MNDIATVSGAIGWETLRVWCLAHGAKNDRVTFIQIDGAGDEFNVILEGYELNDEGRPYRRNKTQMATWRTIQPLGFFPGDR